MLVEFDLSGEWAFDNAPSCAHWVAERADTELCTVREWLRVGHALSVVDEVARRFADGRLSYSKVRALTRVADAGQSTRTVRHRRAVPGRASCRVELAAVAQRPRNATRTARNASGRRRSSKWRLEADGMVAGWFRYPPEIAAIAHRRGRRASGCARSVANTRPRASADSRSVTKWPSLGQQRADALLAVHHRRRRQRHHRSRRPRPR